MKTKAAIALIIGLVFQLSLVIPGMAAAMADCRMAAESCECCAALASCPCAEEGESLPQPLPVAPDLGQTAKAPLAKLASTRVSLETISSPPPALRSVATAPFPCVRIGYTGVPFSVAFCTYLI